MTGAQLAHLAGLAAFAADFFATTDPSAARTFGEAALRADALSSEVSREEQKSRDGIGVPAVQDHPMREVRL
jgi:hypothetical protein